jgi:carboxymethylenebutenolidase
MHYAGKDERIDAGINDFRAALDAHEIAYSIHMYPGTQHGFHNDSSEGRYDAAAAKLAWSRTIAFFDHYLEA